MSDEKPGVRSVIPLDVLQNLRRRSYDLDSPYGRRCPFCECDEWDELQPPPHVGRLVPRRSS